MSLRQNDSGGNGNGDKFSYQSECHCAKTRSTTLPLMARFSYQSECHCAKTDNTSSRNVQLFSYQSECHCAKTNNLVWNALVCLVTSQNVTAPKQLNILIVIQSAFSYQSECHCAKTVKPSDIINPTFSYQSECHCAKTKSRFDAAIRGLVTSQNVTAPKPLSQNLPCKETSIPT